MTPSEATLEAFSAERRRSPALLILVVDPDPDTCAMYVTGLAQSGWAADSETDGRVALARAISCRPAAVVTETRVPCLDGIELCRLLRRDPDTCHIPILVVTSEAEEGRIAKAKEVGADNVLLKPCSPEQLTRALQAILARISHQPSSRFVRLHVPTSKYASRVRSRSKLHERGETTTPPSNPPDIVCPRCDRRLVYRLSHIGGVNASHGEQWDDFECLSGCGRFQYRQRTRKLRELP